MCNYTGLGFKMTVNEVDIYIYTFCRILGFFDVFVL